MNAFRINLNILALIREIQLFGEVKIGFNE